MTNKKPAPQVKQTKSSPFLKGLFIFGLKLFITMLFLFSFYAVYLDSKIQNKFEGQRWEIPVQVFGKVEKISIGDEIKLADITKILLLTGYQKTQHVLNAGEFSTSINKLLMFRRSFDFSAVNSPEQLFTIHIF